MNRFVKMCVSCLVLCLMLFAGRAHAGTVDSASLIPSNAIVVTGTLQPMTFSATNDKIFDIKTFHAELSYTAGLSIADIVTTPAATKTTVDTRKNLIILEWSAVGKGSTITASFNAASYSEGVYTIAPSSLYYADYNRKTYTASSNSAAVSFRYELVAPSSPKKLRSLSGDGFITLFWEGPADTDVAGYKIYRRTAATDFVNIAVSGYPSRDTTVTDGTTYYYRVSVVDGSGNESELSADTAETYTKLPVQTYGIPNASVVATGDLNGDKKPDIIIGDPKFNVGKGGSEKYHAGKVDVYYGGNTTGVPDATLLGENADDEFGSALAVVDMNNDGFDELVVGAPGYDAYVTWPFPTTAGDAGKVYIYSGGTSLGTLPAYTYNGGATVGCGGACTYSLSERLGSSAAPAGDVDNDGYKDVVVGAPFADYSTPTGTERRGKIFVFLGRPSLSLFNPLTFYGPGAPYSMGYAVASAGDVNGDGYDDIIAGNGSIGAFLIYSNPLRHALTLWTGITGASFGWIVASTGDINGDGYSDFVVHRNIYYGGPSVDTVADRILPDAPAFLSPLGDFNKDGFGDLLVSPGPRGYFGGAAAEYVPDFLREGLKILAVNDVDKDGIREVLAGADASAVYVYSLGPLVAANLPDITILSPKNNLATDLSAITINGIVRGNITSLQVGGQYITLQPNGTFTVSEPLSDGANVIEINALSSEGKIGKRWLTIKRAQPTPLTLSITSPADSTVYNFDRTIWVSGLVSDAAANVEINGTPANLYSNVAGNYFGIADVPLAEGPNTFTAVAQDDFGQTATHSITVMLVTKGTVSGVVTDAATGLPLSSVAVTVQDSAGTRTTSTDANGAYMAPYITPGSFTVTFSKTGYYSQTSSGVVSSGQTQTVNAQMPPLTVAITSPQDGATVTSPTINVTGSVSNNATVTVNNIQATVANGVFSASLTLSEGQNPIAAVANDGFGQTATHAITIHYTTKGTINGTVTHQATGAAIASASISVTDSLSVIHTGLTDANGFYALASVSPGQYTGKITTQDYSTFSFSGSITAGQVITVNGSLSLLPPAITAISVSGITTTTAIVTWTTDQPSSSLVEYGETTSYGSNAGDPALKQSHSVTLTGLAPGTMYHYRTTSANSHALASSSADLTFTTGAVPVISSLEAGGITADSAVITWTTDQLSDSRVEYGTTAAYGGEIYDAALATDHSMTLSGLVPSTTYHFKVTSTSENGPSSSPDSVFSTAHPLTLTIASPADNSSISRPDILVKGAITNTTGNETGVTVNGIVATLYDDTFVANHVPLQEGENTITVTATDTAGYTATTAITVTAIATGNYIQLTANVESGISPFETTFRVDGYASDTMPTISYTGPGEVDFTGCTSYDGCKVSMAAEGIYHFTATGTGADGNEYQDTVAVTVISRTEMDALLRAKWEGMKGKLLGGDIETAINSFVDNSKDRYRDKFIQMGEAKVNSIFLSIGSFEFSHLNGQVAECRVVREESAGTFSYPVTFVLAEIGLWKIMGF